MKFTLLILLLSLVLIFAINGEMEQTALTETPSFGQEIIQTESKELDSSAFNEIDPVPFHCADLGASLANQEVIYNVRFPDNKIELKVDNPQINGYNFVSFDADTFQFIEQIEATDDYFIENNLTALRGADGVAFFQGRKIKLPEFDSSSIPQMMEDQRTVLYTTDEKKSLILFDLSSELVKQRWDSLSVPNCETNRTLFCTQIYPVSNGYALLYLMQSTQSTESISPHLGFSLLNLKTKELSSIIVSGPKVRKLGADKLLLSSWDVEMKPVLIHVRGEVAEITTIPIPIGDNAWASMEFSENGKFAVTNHYDEEAGKATYRIYGVETQKELYRFTLPDTYNKYNNPFEYQFVYLSDDGRTVVLTNGSSCEVIQTENTL